MPHERSGRKRREHHLTHPALRPRIDSSRRVNIPPPPPGPLVVRALNLFSCSPSTEGCTSILPNVLYDGFAASNNSQSQHTLQGKEGKGVVTHQQGGVTPPSTNSRSQHTSLEYRMMWAAGVLASISSITYPAISAFVSMHSDADKQGSDRACYEEATTQLHRFLGLCNWLQDFWRWGHDHHTAVESLKASFLIIKQLHRPQGEAPLVLQTDACQNGLGTILYQEDIEGHPMRLVDTLFQRQVETAVRYGNQVSPVQGHAHGCVALSQSSQLRGCQARLADTAVQRPMNTELTSCFRTVYLCGPSFLQSQGIDEKGGLG
ncbi:hypothetical protein PR048_004591 [Dryococelus australis]|uniref:Reverse transcriptase/retrotransposon-derived protein RNase H-like domain-containing protein n=1 Tax=Dryococelus australis TaxID=614101 RepID=A0ABQ9I6N1_9NEOP|nr:hypothetical protein PR048_004591 [Dryococelus australis]